MARRCELTNHGKKKINKLSKERSRITRRTISFSCPNLQTRSFLTELGVMRFKISNRTNRTIEKYGSLTDFLCGAKKNKLSEEGLKLRKKLMKKIMRQESDS